METFEIALKLLLTGECDGIRHEEESDVLMCYDADDRRLVKGYLTAAGKVEKRKEPYLLLPSYYDYKWTIVQDQSEVSLIKEELYSALYRLTSELGTSVKSDIAKIMSIIDQI